MKAACILLMAIALVSIPSGGYCIWVSFGDSTTQARPQIDFQGSNIIELDTYGLIRHDVEVEGETYQVLSYPGGGHLSEIGRPELPTVAILMEIEAEIEPSITILDSTSQLLEGYLSYPAQVPCTDMWGCDSTEFALDDSLYSQDNFYPEKIVALSYPRVLRGHRLVLVIFYPVQHNPVTGQLKVYPSLRVSLGGAGSVASPKDSPYFQSILGRLVLNYQPASKEEVKDNDGADYLIVVHDDLYEQIQPLAQWRHQSGLKTKVVKLSETGNDPDYIWSYVWYAYHYWTPAPSFLLLVGDADLLPVHYKNNHPYVRERNLPVGTDLYYSTVDFENDPPDTHLVDFPDLYVGRLPVNQSNIEVVVDKILQYEKEPPIATPGWFDNILLAGFFQDGRLPEIPPDSVADRFFIQTSELIHDFLEIKGYNMQRVYTCSDQSTPTYYYYGDPIPPELTFNGTTDDIIQAITQGAFIVNHRDHGDSRNGPFGMFEGWDEPDFVAENVPSLNNGEKLPVIFSVNCRSGWFDGETDLDSDDPNPIPDCLGEALLKANGKGGVGFIGATRTSYSGFNDELCKGFYDAIWDDFDPGYYSSLVSSPTDRLGAILNYGKFWMFDKYVLSSGSGYPPDWEKGPVYTRLEFELFNLLGDPATRIWTGVPESLIVSYPNSYQTGSGTFTVNAGEESLQVCLWKENDDYYQRQFTNTNGEAIFNTSFSALDPLWVTVTGHNYIPYQDQVVNCILTENQTWQDSVLVYGNVTVSNGVTLTIEPNTIIKFYENAGLHINGVLNANGQESQYISFIAIDETKPWVGIVFADSSDDAYCFMNRCYFKYANSAISFVEASPINIRNIGINNCDFGILCDNASPHITSLSIGAQGTVHVGISCVSNSDAHIDSVLLSGAGMENSKGIHIQNSNPLIEDGTISGFERGINICGGNPEINDVSLTYNTECGIACNWPKDEPGKQFCDPCSAFIAYNYISHNHIGIKSKSANPIIFQNEIIQNDTVGIYCYGTTTPNIGVNGTCNCGYNTICNDSFNIYSECSDMVKAENNWWCSTNPDSIALKLFGSVDYIPYLIQSPENLPPLSITDLTATLVDNCILLEWSAVTTDISCQEDSVYYYIVYRDTIGAGFSTSSESIAVSNTSYYVDCGVVGDTLINYYYSIKAVDHEYNISSASNQVGEFDKFLSDDGPDEPPWEE
jgi:hypothetical protein